MQLLGLDFVGAGRLNLLLLILSLLSLSFSVSPTVTFQSVHVPLRLFIFFTCVCAEEQRATDLTDESKALSCSPVSMIIDQPTGV